MNVVKTRQVIVCNINGSGYISVNLIPDKLMEELNPTAKSAGA